MISPVTITFACVGILVVFLAVFVVMRSTREDESECSNSCESCKCEEPRATNVINRTTPRSAYISSSSRTPSSAASRNSDADDGVMATAAMHNATSCSSPKSHSSWSSHHDSSSYSSSDSSSSCSDSSSSCSSGCD